MSYNPNLNYFLSRLQGVSTNYFRLEPQSSGSSVITANKIIRFSLPSNTLLNTRSLSFNFNANANGTASAGGRLPADISCLIDRIELSSGGVQISQGCNGINVFTQAKKSLTVDKCDQTLGHPEIVRSTSFVDGGGDWATGSSIASLLTTKNENYRQDAGQTPFSINNFEGFLGSVQPSILDTSLLSDLTLTFYLAGNEVLSSSAGVALDGTGASDITDVNASVAASFQLQDYHLVCETIGLADSIYDQMVEKRISQVGYIELPFKSYYSFNDAHSGSTRFSVSTQSLDRIYAVMRASTYADTPNAPVRIKGYKKVGAYVSTVSGGATYATPIDIGMPQYDVGGTQNTAAEKYRGAYFTFAEQQASAGVPATYQFNLNGSFLPQFKATSEQMLGVSRNSVPTIDMGTGRYPLTSMTLDQYKNNFFAMCVRLCLPHAEENREISGGDTRGISLNAYFASTGVTTGKNVMIFCETTSCLRIGAGRAIEVIA